MALNIVSNFAANLAQRNLSNTDAMATSSLAKLSAGTRVLPPGTMPLRGDWFASAG